MAKRQVARERGSRPLSSREGKTRHVCDALLQSSQRRSPAISAWIASRQPWNLPTIPLGGRTMNAGWKAHIGVSLLLVLAVACASPPTEEAAAPAPTAATRLYVPSNQRSSSC